MGDIYLYFTKLNIFFKHNILNKKETSAKHKVMYPFNNVIDAITPEISKTINQMPNLKVVSAV